MPQKSYTLGNLLQDCLDCDIRKSDIRQFFDDLKKKAHFVYAILCGAPKSVFWITLDDEESHPDEKTFSVAEFNDNYENFDSRIDSFRVNFNAYFFREQWATKFPEWELMENPFNGEERFCATSRKELTVEIFVTEYPHLLAYLCRRAVLENAPFELTRETIKHYGFSREDVKLLRDCIASNNRRIIDELREEYERLKAIDCLQVVPPKRRANAESRSVCRNPAHSQKTEDEDQSKEIRADTKRKKLGVNHRKTQSTPHQLAEMVFNITTRIICKYDYPYNVR